MNPRDPRTAEAAPPPLDAWRTETATRATVLRDAATYFGVLRKALLAAEREVAIVGWDIDSRTPLVGESGEPDDALPRELSAFLSALVKRRPKLRVRLLLWDYSVLFTAEREAMASYTLGWSTPRQITFCFDDCVPLGASHHQKIVLIDDAVAFSGGIDLAIRRWDTPAHRVKEPRRVDPAGKPYRPFHDVQMMVEGPAARAIGDLVRKRWRAARCETLQAQPAPATSPWPADVAPDFRDCQVSIARTLPAFQGESEVREVERWFLGMIARAERTLYIENQFVTAPKLAKAIAARIRERPELEVLIVAPQQYQSWLESKTMRTGRIGFVQVLERAGVSDRIRLLTPLVEEDGERAAVMVHAKIMIVDDTFLRVGSANLNNRSLGTDTECDLIVHGTEERHRKAIRDVRDALLGEHLGAEGATVTQAVADTGSLFGAIDRLNGGPHRLAPLKDGEIEDRDAAAAMAAVADPERPIDPEVFVDMMAERRPVRRNLSGIARLTLIAAAVAALVLVWQVTPLREYADFATVERAVATIASDPLAPAYVILGFVVSGLVAFPVMIAIAVTAVTFGAWLGLAYAATGALASALVTYGVGALVGAGLIESLLGRRFTRISRRIKDKGILAVAAIRMVPIAPFTVINLLAGASRIRLRDYTIGTMLGLTPGLLVIAPLGRQAYEVLTDPSIEDTLMLLGLALVWLTVSFGLQRVVSRYERSNR
ncbi:phospholipase D1/2 [Constrictibacter sp. MBR-5]|uniref:VTT domain-containing protein n=1 Tax=Constrictibacter sp. MBR-5 TaxID=3156467 RepID=UPI0033997173